jgi:hypothetical protein
MKDDITLTQLLIAEIELLQASTLLKYAAPWLKNARKVVRSKETGRFASKTAHESQEAIAKVAKSKGIEPAGLLKHSGLELEAVLDRHRLNEVVKDKQGTRYLAKRPEGAKTKLPDYDIVSEVVGMHVLEEAGAKTAKIFVEDNPTDPVRMYSQFVPGKQASTAISEKEMPRAIASKLEYNYGMNLGSQSSLEVAIEHPDLAKIYAADVFSGNRDRHINNLFYDKATDSFHAIDNEATFSSYPMPNVKNAVEQGIINALVNAQNNKLAAHQLDNLKTFKQSLDKLVKMDAQKIIDEANQLFNKIAKTENKYDAENAESLRKGTVTRNIEFAKELLEKYNPYFEGL